LPVSTAAIAMGAWPAGGTEIDRRVLDYGLPAVHGPGAPSLRQGQGRTKVCVRNGDEPVIGKLPQDACPPLALAACADDGHVHETTPFAERFTVGTAPA